MILDLSKKGQGRLGQELAEAVNELTSKNAAPLKSMEQLGKVLLQFIFAIALAPESDGPLLFCKLDIKDGF